MGFFKKIKKAVSKVVSKSSGGLIGGSEDKPKAAAVEAPAAATPAAQVVEAPKEDGVVNEDENTESARKKAKAGGKKGLSVTRSTKGGLNI